MNQKLPRRKWIINGIAAAAGLSGLAVAARLHGGSDEDHAEAREWVSLFFHEAVIRKVAAAGDKREKLCPRRGQAQETQLCG